MTRASAVSALQHLIAEAVALGGGDLCAAGHAWESIGGRTHCDDCPIAIEIERRAEAGMRPFGQEPSQPVYECARCGEVDYGDVGGPGHADCVQYCRKPTAPPAATQRVVGLQEAAAREARHSRRMCDLMDWERSLGYGDRHRRRLDINAQVRSAEASEAAREAYDETFQ